MKEKTNRSHNYGYFVKRLVLRHKQRIRVLLDLCITQCNVSEFSQTLATTKTTG